jgi:hypothetical protein
MKPVTALPSTLPRIPALVNNGNNLFAWRASQTSPARFQTNVPRIPPMPLIVNHKAGYKKGNEKTNAARSMISKIAKAEMIHKKNLPFSIRPNPAEYAIVMTKVSAPAAIYM